MISLGEGEYYLRVVDDAGMRTVVITKFWKLHGFLSWDTLRQTYISLSPHVFYLTQEVLKVYFFSAETAIDFLKLLKTLPAFLPLFFADSNSSNRSDIAKLLEYLQMQIYSRINWIIS